METKINRTKLFNGTNSDFTGYNNKLSPTYTFQVLIKHIHFNKMDTRKSIDTRLYFNDTILTINQLYHQYLSNPTKP